MESEYWIDIFNTIEVIDDIDRGVELIQKKKIAP